MHCFCNNESVAVDLVKTVAAIRTGIDGGTEAITTTDFDDMRIMYSICANTDTFSVTAELAIEAASVFMEVATS